jgi:hypothetical protein
MEIDNYIKKLPRGLKRFVEKSLDLIELNDFYEDFRKRGGHLDGFHMHVELIRWFLRLKIEFPKEKVYEEYKEVNYVYELPESQIHQCLFYLNFLIGATPHTGGHDFVKIYEKYKVLNVK